MAYAKRRQIRDLPQAVRQSAQQELVARQPSSDQVWLHSIFPLTPVVAILLVPANIDVALAEAANGLHVFLENGNDKKAFKIVGGAGQQPSYEFFVVKNEGRVRDAEGKRVFEAARLGPAPAGTAQASSGAERTWVEDTFEVVDQLRGMNATRILLVAGQHLSRIGLDFISMPTG